MLFLDSTYGYETIEVVFNFSEFYFQTTFLPLLFAWWPIDVFFFDDTAFENVGSKSGGVRRILVERCIFFTHCGVDAFPMGFGWWQGEDFV